MTLKRFLSAVIISSIVLFLEFKVIPFVLKKTNLFRPKIISPVAEAQKSKFELKYALLDSQISLWQGPFVLEGIGGIEVLIVEKGRPIKIIFSSERDPRSQLASLQLILKESKMLEAIKNGPPPKLIDLTGDKPYVSF